MQQAVQPNPLIRTELIEVLINNAAASEFILGQLPTLRDAARILQIEAFHNGQITNAPTGRPVVATATFQKASLKLISIDQVEYRHVALTSISKSVNGTVIPMLNVPQIDPEKSKIFVGDTTGVTVNQVFLFEITYEKRK